MKSVGEAMAIGRTFQESLQKALRSLETGLTGLDEITHRRPRPGRRQERDPRRARLARRQDGLLKVAQAMRLGFTDAEIHSACKVDPWFLAQVRGIVETEAEIRAKGLPKTAGAFRRLKAMGFSDARLGKLTGSSADDGDAEARARSTCGRCSSASTPAPPSSPRRPPTCIRPTRRRSRGQRRRQRGAAVGQEEGRHPRRRAEPHRPGHRVRLLLLPRRLRAEGGGLRNHHDQLQSGDGLDRLRHLRPALFRAAHRRGRAGDHRHRARATARCTA